MVCESKSLKSHASLVICSEHTEFRPGSAPTKSRINIRWKRTQRAVAYPLGTSQRSSQGPALGSHGGANRISARIALEHPVRSPPESASASMYRLAKNLPPISTYPFLRIRHVRKIERLASFRQRDPCIPLARIMFALLGIVGFLRQRCALRGRFPCGLALASHLVRSISTISPLRRRFGNGGELLAASITEQPPQLRL
jgi:hypothetical protein